MFNLIYDAPYAPSDEDEAAFAQAMIEAKAEAKAEAAAQEQRDQLQAELDASFDRPSPITTQEAKARAGERAQLARRIRQVQAADSLPRNQRPCPPYLVEFWSRNGVTLPSGATLADSDAALKNRRAA